MLVQTIPAFNPGPQTGAGNNTYLLTGQEPLLVDAGVGDPRHLDEVGRALGGVPLARVVVTHHHSDHAAGIAAIAARWPGVACLKKPWPERDGRYGVSWAEVDEGDEIPAGDGSLVALWTPGHAPDHLCLFDEESRTLFGGDLLVRGHTVVIPASHGGSLSQYLASLARVRRLHPDRVLPAHGEPIDHPEALIDAYVEHRMQREAQILAALAGGASTPVAIVPRVYDALPPALFDFARESVLAHLVKLQEEGSVRRVEEKWELRSQESEVRSEK